MGLDMTHGAFHGAYSAFNRFREKIAIAAGYSTITTQGRFGPQTFVDIDWDAFTEENINGEWGDTVPSDALLYLIVHSDCDGHLEPEACGRLAERLDGLLPQIDAIPSEQFGHIGEFGAKSRQLIAGLRAAHAASERLEFF